MFSAIKALLNTCQMILFEVNVTLIARCYIYGFRNLALFETAVGVSAIISPVLGLVSMLRLIYSTRCITNLWGFDFS